MSHRGGIGRRVGLKIQFEVHSGASIEIPFVSTLPYRTHSTLHKTLIQRIVGGEINR